MPLSMTVACNLNHTTPDLVKLWLCMQAAVCQPPLCAWRDLQSSSRRAIVSIGHLHLLLSSSVASSVSQRWISLCKIACSSCTSQELVCCAAGSPVMGASWEEGVTLQKRVHVHRKTLMCAAM